MLTFTGFTGINNILAERRLQGNDLIRAENVDVGLTREVRRREGYAELDPTCHKNLWDGRGFMLATCGSALTAIWENGDRLEIDPALGSERVWYCNLPDGRTTYTNGFIHGVTDGHLGFNRTVPVPSGLGAASSGAGQLHPGQYRYFLTFTRLSDWTEGPALESGMVSLNGALVLSGLPVRDGHVLSVYMSGQDGEGAFLAGTTMDPSFVYSGKNAELVLPCRTLGAREVPVGTVTAFWRGRVLTAVGDTLWASRPSNPYLSDWRDFKPMEAPITAIIPVADGVYVGTQEDLFFLAGSSWDSLAMVRMKRGPVVLGSGVTAPGHLLAVSDDGATGRGESGVCIAGGEIVATMPGGQVASLSDRRYRTNVTEVWAVFRESESGPQYIAVPL